jgi:hypothetical protein
MYGVAETYQRSWCGGKEKQCMAAKRGLQGRAAILCFCAWANLSFFCFYSGYKLSMMIIFSPVAANVFGYVS